MRAVEADEIELIVRQIPKHRVSETVGSNTTDLYYSAGWQVLEERVNGSGKYRYVWSPVYVDAMILRDRLDATERIWVQQDANFNVTAITDGSGVVLERYTNDPFGVRTVLTPSFGSRSASSYDFKYGFQGMDYDSVSGLDVSRMRPGYSPTLGRWVIMDPISYGAGDVNLYGFVVENPVNGLDPSGLEGYGRNHSLPLFLGGRNNQPLIGMSAAEHTAFHDCLRSKELQP